MPAMSIRRRLLGLASLLLVSPAHGLRIPEYATIVDRDTAAATYDFVIAGGGIAGLTVADRLTEDPHGK